MSLLYHAYVYLEFLILACTIYILVPDFLTRHEEEIPATMEKLNKEKLALLKEIGVVVRRIAREQEKLAKEKVKKCKKNNRTNHKKEV